MRADGARPGGAAAAAFAIFGTRRLNGEKAEAIESLIAPTVASMGCAVVRVRLSGGRAPRLQVMVERGDGGAVTVDDCAEVSRAVSAALDAEDPIGPSYTLEVSSPGIDRPLVRPADFARFAGHDAKLETTEAIGGRKRFRGRLLGYVDPHVRIDLGGGEGAVRVPFAAVRSARLVGAGAPAGGGGGAEREGRTC